MKRKEWLLLVGGLLAGAGLGIFFFFGLGVWNGQAQTSRLAPGKEIVSSGLVGTAAPDFELKNISGNSVHLNELKGKPVLLNFWATWCGPCEVEMPAIEARYERHQAELSILAVNFDEPEKDVRQYAERLGLSFDILLDPGGKIQDLYRVRGYPTTYLVDAEGVIRVHHVGSMSEEQLDSYLQQVGINP